MNWKKAMCLLSKGKVEVLKYTEKVIKTAEGLLVKLPAVMRLIKFIRTLYKTKVPFSKRSVIIRDGMSCAYCGVKDVRLTIDHIVPKARGGKSTFENTIASCKPCNAKKGSKTCSEAKMYPRVKAFAPTISEFLAIRVKKLGVDDILKELFNGI